ncbi:ligase-associated DNA damage response endonuclease PdeM [Robertkochia aurantiaca]|uniref:ligase-associated DNA damage response endonuclease PdeM n=1 Tax=Robertkochia aurantiaca TaxID=2873700 RepID=UPI001CCE4578|nr:ligase-associated DNA damage response endonuclease PdeM [Robertkochia sp. 3YJGBD-33]
MKGTQKLEISGQHFTLHPSGVAFWEEKKQLLVADVHLGKTQHFRKHGIPVPGDTALRAYERLSAMLDLFRPEDICFLGDLFHSVINSEFELFESWVRNTPVNFTLVVGNHDIVPHHKLESLGFNLTEEIRSKGFLLTHHPTEEEDFFNICGHVHPGISLKGLGRQKLRLPCFYKTEKRLILPAFGDFTGKYILRPGKKDKVFAVTPEEVILVSRES